MIVQLLYAVGLNLANSRYLAKVESNFGSYRAIRGRVYEKGGLSVLEE